MKIKKITFLSLTFAISIINGMDSKDNTFDMDDFIKCTLASSEAELENCIKHGYLKSKSRKQLSPEDITDESKDNLVRYFFTKNDSFDPSENDSTRYHFANGPFQMKDKIDHTIGDCPKIFQQQKNQITYDIATTLVNIAKEHNDLQLNQDFDDILECMVNPCLKNCEKYLSTNNKKLTDQAKKTIKKHNEFIKKEYTWYGNYTLRYNYPAIRLKALHTYWKKGKDVCELTDLQISEVIKIITEIENS